MHCILYISHVTYKENFSNNQKKTLEFVIIFFVMTFRFNSGVILLGENEMPISLWGKRVNRVIDVTVIIPGLVM